MPGDRLSQIAPRTMSETAAPAQALRVWDMISPAVTTMKATCAAILRTTFRAARATVSVSGSSSSRNEARSCRLPKTAPIGAAL
jgi:hypothetical protein